VQEVAGEMAHDGEVMGGVVGAGAAGVRAESHVEDPVDPMLAPLVGEGGAQEVRVTLAGHAVADVALALDQADGPLADDPGGDSGLAWMRQKWDDSCNRRVSRTA